MITVANNILSTLTVLGQIGILVLLTSRLIKKNLPGVEFIKSRTLVFSFIVALAAALGSLFYSQIAGYEPCALCWYQRIFLYPQVFILGLALIKKDFSVAPYIQLLSAIGAIIAGYQHLLQLGWVPSLVCTAVGGVSCAQRFVMGFGYITLPLMSFTAFLLLIIITSFIKNKSK
ncbi:MAG: disulfide bond formation protein B [Candidatus Sungbacteria bacterium]|uniref:Disulfide bond formation protein B n=1 Tax=Candidatus Sungiibacteriota bacterium TaxID=2750080 RepID=A0A932DS26_9BACT|nr:disulfide bond formation protein B [Candidatus Sungbacteria bacterium]MBI2465721.1 disulfide bond formation protein B [Candidatus Sungbacteria bacterium]